MTTLEVTNVTYRATQYITNVTYRALIITDITSPPQSVNISLNGVAVFNCTYVPLLIWLADGVDQIVNGSNGYKFSTMPYGLPNIRTTTLEVTASMDKNNTNITCTAISRSPLSKSDSEPALLLIQGMHMYIYMYLSATYKTDCSRF